VLLVSSGLALGWRRGHEVNREGGCQILKNCTQTAINVAKISSRILGRNVVSRRPQFYHLFISEYKTGQLVNEDTEDSKWRENVRPLGK